MNDCPQTTTTEVRSADLVHDPAIWKILLQKTASAPKSILPSVLEEGRQFQILECLIAILFSELLSEYQWFSTPIQGDDGLDFFGEKPKNRNRLFPPTSVALGQSKFSSGRKNIIQQLKADIGRIVPRFECNHLDAVYVVVARSERSVITKSERDQLTNATDITVRILDIDELDYLMRINFAHLKDFLHRSIQSRSEFERVDEYFSTPKRLYDPGWTQKVISPKIVGTGETFEVKIELKTERLLPGKFFTQWSRGHHSIVVRGAPKELSLGKHPISIDPWRAIGHSFRLYTYSIGNVNLGKLDILDQDDSLIYTIDLGNIWVENRFEPDFIVGRNGILLAGLSEVVTRVSESQCVEVRAIIGPGGTGKTRLVQEAAILFEQAAGVFVSVSCGDGPDSLSKFLTELISKSLLLHDLSNNDGEFNNYILDCICCLPQARKGNMRHTIANLLGGKTALDLQSFAEIGEIIFGALAHASIERPLFIHISEVHRSTPMLCRLLSSIVARAREKKTPFGSHARILFVFELRASAFSETLQNTFHIYDHEILRTSKFNSEDSYAYCRYALRQFLAPEWVPFLASSRGHVFVRAISTHVHAPIELPEVLRQLIRHDVVMLGRDGGHLVVVKSAIPSAVQAVLANDKLTGAELSSGGRLTLRALSLVGERFHRGVFEAVMHTAGLGSFDARAEISRWLLETAGSNDVTFRHESYYLAARNLVVDPSRFTEMLCVVQRYYESNGTLNPSDHLRLADIEFAKTSCDIGNVRFHYNEAINAARISGAEAVRIKARKGILSTFPQPTEAAQDLVVSDLMLWLESALDLMDDNHFRPWTERLEFLREMVIALRRISLRKDIEAVSIDVNAAEMRCRLRLSNDLFHLARHSEAIEELDCIIGELRPIIEHPADELHGQVARRRFLQALDRKGVAVWFGGFRQQASAIFGEVIEKGGSWGDELLEDIFWLDFHAVRATIEPKASAAALRRLACSARRPHGRLSLLANAHAILCDLLDWQREPKHDSSNNRLVQLRKEAERVLQDGTALSAPNEIVFSRMLIAAIRCFDDPISAICDFMEARDRAKIDSNHEFYWKCSINLVQLYHTMGDTNEPQKTLAISDFLAAVDWDIEQQAGDRRIERISYYRLPLAHVVIATLNSKHGSRMARQREKAEALLAEAGISRGNYLPKGKSSALLQRFRRQTSQAIISNEEIDIFLFA